MLNNKYFSLALIILITFSASFIGSYATMAYKEPWYSELILPTFNPPSAVFAPVWTTLYIMMSVAIWLVWKRSFNNRVMTIYFVHLFFNAIWSVLFFGYHNILLALIDLIIILGFIIWLMVIYFRENKISFYLMVPYLLWSSYAFVLNLTILVIN
jgi:benzodiazapine receptor